MLKIGKLKTRSVISPLGKTDKKLVRLELPEEFWVKPASESPKPKHLLAIHPYSVKCNFLIKPGSLLNLSDKRTQEMRHKELIEAHQTALRKSLNSSPRVSALDHDKNKGFIDQYFQQRIQPSPDLKILKNIEASLISLKKKDNFYTSNLMERAAMIEEDESHDSQFFFGLKKRNREMTFMKRSKKKTARKQKIKLIKQESLPIVVSPLSKIRLN